MEEKYEATRWRSSAWLRINVQREINIWDQISSFIFRDGGIFMNANIKRKIVMKSQNIELKRVAYSFVLTFYNTA
jgi:hypothetical protein